MAVRGDGLLPEEGSSTPNQKIVYVMHPNCAIEDFEIKKSRGQSRA
jgi:hypothetical protein